MPNETTSYEEDFTAPKNALAVCFCVLVCMALNLMLNKYHLHWIPESGLAILLGVIIGGGMNLFGYEQDTESVMFDPPVFFYVLLPPIVFEAGWSLRKRFFFENLGSIVIFAVIGTSVSTAIVGYGLFALSAWGAVNVALPSMIECLMFGSLISATDPVATLAILGSPHVNADETLYALVFGESILNDAVSIVLFNTFRGFVTREFTGATIWEALGEFLGISIASTIIGVACGLACAWVMKRLNFHDLHHYEFILVVFFGYAAYCFCQIVELSGIMSLFFCGIVMAHYTSFSMTKDSRQMTSVSLKGIAMMCETFLFVYLGITVAVFLRADYRLDWSFTMIVFSIILCAIGRLFQIMVLGVCVNTRRTKKIPWKMLWVMVFAGLRGAIAFALSLNVTTPNRDLIVSTTVTIVLATTLGNGTLTLPFLTKMGMVRPPGSPEEPPTVFPPGKKKTIGQRWIECDRRTMQRIFGGAYFPKNAAPMPQPGEEFVDDHTHTLPPPPHRQNESKVESQFSVGDEVYAPWSDGNYYNATIEAQLDESERDVTFRVKFLEINEGGVVYQSQLRREKPK